MAAATSESSDKSNSNRKCTYWVREDDDREFITDPNGEILNLARLTAYVNHGKEIYDAHAHHKLPLYKIGTPELIDAVEPGTHNNLDHQNPQEVDGIPLIQN